MTQGWALETEALVLGKSARGFVLALAAHHAAAS
jgi:hypothetical protein